jgi:hypothetical protein
LIWVGAFTYCKKEIEMKILLNDVQKAIIKEAMGEDAYECVRRNANFEEISRYDVQEIISALCEEVKRYKNNIISVSNHLKEICK